MSNTTKCPGKLEYRQRDPKEDPERLGKKIYRRFQRKEELNGMDEGLQLESMRDGKPSSNPLHLLV
jgi:hypothetical protein